MATSSPSLTAQARSCGTILTMILGRVAYLGSLSRRSAVTTAGRDTLMLSKPPSISRVILRHPSPHSRAEVKVAWEGGGGVRGFILSKEGNKATMDPHLRPVQ